MMRTEFKDRRTWFWKKGGDRMSNIVTLGSCQRKLYFTRRDGLGFGSYGLSGSGFKSEFLLPEPSGTDACNLHFSASAYYQTQQKMITLSLENLCLWVWSLPLFQLYASYVTFFEKSHPSGNRDALPYKIGELDEFSISGILHLNDAQLRRTILH
jgi:hypothetical protein